MAMQKGDFKKNSKRALKILAKPALIGLCCVIWNDYSREHISKKNQVEIPGCIVRSTAKTARTGFFGIVIDSQGEEEVVVTGSLDEALAMKERIGQCFTFTIFRHSFPIPNFGKQYIVDIKPNPIK